MHSGIHENEGQPCKGQAALISYTQEKRLDILEHPVDGNWVTTYD